MFVGNTVRKKHDEENLATSLLLGGVAGFFYYLIKIMKFYHYVGWFTHAQLYFALAHYKVRSQKLRCVVWKELVKAGMRRSGVFLRVPLKKDEGVASGGNMWWGVIYSQVGFAALLYTRWGQPTTTTNVQPPRSFSTYERTPLGKTAKTSSLLRRR